MAVCHPRGHRRRHHRGYRYINGHVDALGVEEAGCQRPPLPLGVEWYRSGARFGYRHAQRDPNRLLVDYGVGHDCLRNRLEISTFISEKMFGCVCRRGAVRLPRALGKRISFGIPRFESGRRRYSFSTRSMPFVYLRTSRTLFQQQAVSKRR